MLPSSGERASHPAANGRAGPATPGRFLGVAGGAAAALRSIILRGIRLRPHRARSRSGDTPAVSRFQGNQDYCVIFLSTGVARLITYLAFSGPLFAGPGL